MRRVILLALFIATVAGVALLYTPDKPRAVLEAAYARPPSVFIAVAGTRLHVRDTGPRAAPAVILLHGFGSSLQTWDAWVPGLEADNRVIRFDLPGFGLTGADPSGDYSDRRSVGIVLGLMDQLSIQRATLVGNSMGGRIAWTLAALHPDRVTKLVLMAPDGFASPGMQYGVAPTVPWLMRLLPYTLPTFMLRSGLAPAYADPSALTQARLDRYRDMMLAPGVRRSILARMPQTVLVPPEPLLARIEAPTLLLWGRKDAMVPITNAADYQRVIPQCRLVSLPNVGHLPQEEAPAESLAVLRSFIT